MIYILTPGRGYSQLRGGSFHFQEGGRTKQSRFHAAEEGSHSTSDDCRWAKPVHFHAAEGSGLNQKWYGTQYPLQSERRIEPYPFSLIAGELIYSIKPFVIVFSQRF